MFLTSTQLLFVFLLSAMMVTSVWWITHRASPRPEIPVNSPKSNRRSLFLFRAGHLIDANPAALQICAETPVDEFDWSALRNHLSPLFPEFPASQGAAQDRDILVLQSSDPADGTILTLDQWNDVARVTIEHDDAPDAARRTAIMQAMFQAPNPVWKSNTQDQVVWRNGAYKELMSSLGYAPKHAPIFDTSDLLPGEPARRLSISNTTNDKTRWFDVTAVQAGPNVMYYATEADAVVSALDAQRSFVQTFSKTFAQLSTGLAIFDKNETLILFNPALTELTGVGADFLSNHCDLKAFFDQLRERHVAPNPKLNVTWGAQIRAITHAASMGRYSETWTLPSGVTYRVSGRPHPEGALAFLFEDITAEITVTRRFRAELEQCHNVLDTLQTALVLFSSSGQLHLCNAAYRNLWKSDPESSFAEYTLRDAISHWEGDCLPNAIWSEVRNRILSTTDRDHWYATITTKSLSSLRLTLTPISGGMTLVSFDEILPFGNSVTTTSKARLDA